ncbi:MAG TPA: AAA family ATPase [Clostridium sp.]|jgi:DNA sulfur modification protein DndD|nr:AAA family ATPase [Clostridium sp.]
MLLKSLKLLNFRQFKGKQEISFATDEVKNVTVIMGENGSGKTTLAQAFSWCLYGDTDFDDKSMINKVVAGQMLPDNESKVRVDLSLNHSGTDYTITREQVYKKDFTGKIKAMNATFNISYKKDGQQEFLKPLEVEPRMKQILPKELSKYFFFDGERIGNMSKEIKKGKSQDFAQAVRGLLGLNAFLAALEHLKPTSKYGVIGSYNESYDSSSDSNIARHSKEIDEAQEKLDKINARLKEIDNEIQIARERCEELSTKIQKNADGEKLQKQKDKLLKQRESTKQARVSAIGSMMKHFNSNAHAYFAKSMIKGALESLSEADKLDKGIPDMHARTIEFLINRRLCVCGNKIEFGNDAHKELIKALEFLPPQSIGMSIGHFVKESELRSKTSDSLFENISEQYSIIREYENKIVELTNDIKTIEDQLVGMESVSRLQQDLMRYERVIRACEDEKNDLNRQIGAITTKKERAETERAELTLRDEKNRKIEIYKAYAQYMYDELSTIYKRNEAETREKLQITINEIFKSIYEGGMSLTIDEKYNIQVTVNDFEGYYTDVETSTAQSISVIFAFISGIIKMARENSNSIDAGTKMLESEPYPLVMDAPLSAFDKRRIKTVCDALPNIAEQVIIFIKDTDGEIAEENMGEKVGKRYLFDKKNEFETYLMVR